MAQFDRLTVYNTILEDGMMPLFYDANIDTAKQTLTALANGGSRLLEFTNRGDFAIEVFSELAKYCIEKHPQVIIGVGAVEDAATAALYAAHGANFIVGPTFTEEVARFCNRRKLAYLPGCGSLNEIKLAEEWGVENVKVFPAFSSGGAKFVKAILGPRPWTKVMPTGGLGPDQAVLQEWFDAGVVCVGMGSSVVKKAWIAAGEFEKITTLTSDTLALVKRIRA